MPRADQKNAVILAACTLVAVAGGIGCKKAADNYNETYAHYNNFFKNREEEKRVYDPNGPEQYTAPAPSAPELTPEELSQETSAPQNKPCELGFINDIGHQTEQSFVPQYVPTEGWIYEDAYNVPTNAAPAQPTSSVYADAFVSETADSSAYPQEEESTATATPAADASPMQEECPQPPAYDPGNIQPFAEQAPNTIKFNSKVHKGNIIRLQPQFSQYSNFKLSDIKYVMFEDEFGHSRCYRVKHGRLNWFANWHGDCLISTFYANGREHTIYWVPRNN